MLLYFVFYPHLLVFIRCLQQVLSTDVTVFVFIIRLPPYANEFIEMCLMITADHGPGKYHAIRLLRMSRNMRQLLKYNVV